MLSCDIANQRDQLSLPSLRGR